MARGDFRVLDEERAAELYEATVERLGAAGLADYEISNFAKAGEESRHNLTYWRYGDYVGIGPGAHGRLDLGGQRFATPASRARRPGSTGRAGNGEPPASPTAAERVKEMLMMGLRLKEGVPLARVAVAAGGTGDDRLDTAALDRLIADGLLELHAGRLAASAAGRQRLDALLAALVR